MVRNQLQEAAQLAAKKLRVPREMVAAFAAGASAVLKISGTLPGQSIRYAARRRRAFERLQRHLSEQFDYNWLTVYDVEDAISRLYDHINSKIILVTEGRVRLLGIESDRAGLLTVRFAESDRIHIRKHEKAISDILAACRGDADIIGSRVIYLGLPAEHGRGIHSSDIVRALRACQPATPKQLAEYLADRMGTKLGVQEINAELDRLRHRGLVFHIGGKLHYLSPAGNKVTPSYPGRDSPDVQRVLALGRRFR